MKQKSVGAQWIFIHFFKMCFIQGSSKGGYRLLFRKQFYGVIMDYAITTCSGYMRTTQVLLCNAASLHSGGVYKGD